MISSSLVSSRPVFPALSTAITVLWSPPRTGTPQPCWRARWWRAPPASPPGCTTGFRAQKNGRPTTANPKAQAVAGRPLRASPQTSGVERGTDQWKFITAGQPPEVEGLTGGFAHAAGTRGNSMRDQGATTGAVRGSGRYTSSGVRHGLIWLSIHPRVASGPPTNTRTA